MQYDWKNLAVIAFLFLVLSAYSLQFNAYTMDEYTYVLMAKAYASGNLSESPESTRFPAFPFLLSLAFRIFGSDLLVARMFNFAVGLTAIAFAYYAARKMFSQEAAFWAGTFLASSPLFAFLSGRILTEALFIFLLMLAVLLIGKSVQNKLAVIALGPVFALLVLTRFFGLYLAPVALIYWWREKKLGETLLSKEFTLGVIGFFIVVSPWLLYSHALTGDYLGFFKDFFASNVQLEKGGFALPDLIPSYLLFVPLVSGAAFAAFALKPPAVKEILKQKGAQLLLLSTAVVSLSLEVYGLLHFRLLRYLVPIVPFVCILAGATLAARGRFAFDLRGIPEKHWRAVFAFLILANVAAAAFAIQAFGNSPKHSGYYEAGVYARSCGMVYSNIDRVISVIAQKPLADVSQADCFVVSAFDPTPHEPMPAGMTLAYENKGMKVYRK